MKFDGDPIARRRALEAAQRYRGLTFTDRGEILLDVGNVRNGRVTLSQRGQRVSLLPETIFSIHQAWQDGDVPLEGEAPWEGSTFSAYDSEVDEVRCVCHAKEQIRITDKRSHTEVCISREQLKDVVDCIVEPWLAKSPTTRGRSAEVSSPRASQDKSVPVVGLS
jgi:hypothetical protein